MSRKIAVCGGTSLGHAIAAVLGADSANRVFLLTRQPDRWSSRIRAIYLDIAEIVGEIALATDDVRAAIGDADVVLVCTPLQFRAELLTAIAPHLSEGAWVGGVPGFGGFDRAAAVLGGRARVFGLQRVPYVRRTVSYGEVVWISGIRPHLFVGTSPSRLSGEAAALVEDLFGIPSSPLSSYRAVGLSASNAIFHPARLMTSFPAPRFRAARARGDQFYAHWDDDASAAYLALDRDVQACARACRLSEQEVQPITRHFGIETPAQLTARIRSICALRDRRLPVRGTERRLDLESPYVTEDAWFALPAIKAVAEATGVETPFLDAALDWACEARDWCDREL